MHAHRSTAARNDRTPPRMGPVLAEYAFAYFTGGVAHSTRLHALLLARIRTWGADVVAEQARQTCRHDAGRKGA